MSSSSSYPSLKAGSAENSKSPKMCCMCPETRKRRDECIISKGEEQCFDLIEAHKRCLREFGLNMSEKAEMRYGARFRVLGTMLPSLVNREVCIIGKAIQVASSGQSLLVRCVDGPEVQCHLLSPLQTSPENFIVEVQGRVVDNRGQTLEATADVIIFSHEMTEKFNESLYSQCVQMTADYDRFYVQPMGA
ncbi:unnamed protein product [Protopolystoma xenopodis]|uniref:Cytochrome c oxidase copper chaperone n=1 Tax=Protopolystoma xenopodis TaxID=117903 RepID=A0A3S4ZXH1_9PLAT|nr:unnamed protein product [Protopolystoma xenopodis]